MNIKFLNKNRGNKKELSSVESYNIWNMLRVRYASIEKHQLYLNFVHDMDFADILNNQMNNFQDEVKILEYIANKFKIKLPVKSPKEIKFTAQIDAITDRLIYRQILSDLIFELDGVKRAAVSSTTDDNLRSSLINFTINNLEIYKRYYKYICPMYKEGN